MLISLALLVACASLQDRGCARGFVRFVGTVASLNALPYKGVTLRFVTGEAPLDSLISICLPKADAERLEDAEE